MAKYARLSILQLARIGGIEVVVYSDSQGNLYTLSASEFEVRFKQVEKIVLFKCDYNDIYGDMQGV